MYITENVYKIDATRGAYSYAIKTPEGITLIDTGMPGAAEAILKELEVEGLTEVKQILLTHHDIDHIGNAAELSERFGCGVYISKNDLPYITGELKRPGIKRLAGFIMKAKVPQKLMPLPDSLGAITALPAPGHTPGHTCYLLGDVLLLGDLVRTKDGKIKHSPARMSFDVALLARSIQSLSSVQFEWICPAHGEPVKTSSLNYG